MKDRAYEIAINPNYDGYQRGLACLVYKFFDKKTGSGANVNGVLAQELHKPVIIILKRRKVHAMFKGNIWEEDLAEMGSLSLFNRGVKYYTWANPLKDKKAKTVLNGFIRIVNKSKRKPNKLWVDQGREFYNSLIQKWLEDNNVLMYSTHNERKSVVAESFEG